MPGRGLRRRRLVPSLQRGVPFDTPPRAVHHIEGWDAEVVYEGSDERGALLAGRNMARSCGGSFLDPRASLGVDLGLATLGAEIVAECPDAAAVLLVGPPRASRATARYLAVRRPGLAALQVDASESAAWRSRYPNEPPPGVARAAERAAHWVERGGDLVVALLETRRGGVEG